MKITGGKGHSLRPAGWVEINKAGRRWEGKRCIELRKQKEKEDVKLGKVGRQRKNEPCTLGDLPTSLVSTNIDSRIRLLPKLLFKTI